MHSPFTPVVEAIAPARLGRNFRWLLGESLITNIGDGVALAAGPLLVASQTRDPLARLVRRPEPDHPEAHLRGTGRRHRRPLRPATDRRPRQPRAGHRPRPARGDDRQRHDQHPVRPGRPVRPRDERDLRRRRDEQPAPRRGPARGSRHRERAAPGHVPAGQPARRPADRRVPVRDRHGPPVRHERRLLRARGPPRDPGRPVRSRRSARSARTPASARTWPRASGGSGPIRRCGPCSSRSSRSTSRSARRGRCSCSTRASAWAWTRWGSGS